MSEFIATRYARMWVGCNDCGGLRRVVRGRRPKDTPDCTCNPRWVLFTKRTNDPKLAWIEMRLDELRIPHRRNGESFHAPILEVPEEHHERATMILTERIGRYTVDDIRDDHPRWNEELADVDTTPIQYGPPHGGW